MKAFNRRNRPIIWILMIFSLNRLPFLDRNWFHIRFPTKISRKFTTFSPPKARLVAGGHCIKKEGSTAKFGKCGEDSFMVSQKEDSSSALFAVADGVGGWISHGGDSSGVSNGMLKAMKILHQKNNETASISHLIKDAFKKLIEYGKLSKGTTTICAGLYDSESGNFEIANLGDSQMLVIRDGKVFLEVEPGTFAFNSPYQIGFGLYGEPQGDIDEMTSISSIKLKRGDIIVAATDGLFDNVFIPEINEFIASKHSSFVSTPSDKLTAFLAQVSKELAQRAYKLGKNEEYKSPFAVEAIKAKKAPPNYSGGKPDDISIIIAFVK